MKAARPMVEGHRRPSTGWVAACLVGCLLSGLLSRSARAEVPHEWLGARVEGVSVMGEAAARVSPREVGVPVGVPLTRGLIREAVRALSDTGLYRDVQIDARRTGRGVELLVRLTPRFVAMRIDIVGNDHLSRRELIRALGLREEGEVEREELPEAAQRAQARYAELGFRSSQVRVVMRDTDDPIQKVLHVEVEEGPETLIEGYVFVGDPLPKRKGLRRTLSLDEGERLDVDQVDVTMIELERKLREAGYYEANFGEVELQVKDERAILRVQSHVGPHYRIAIAGNEPLGHGEIFDELNLSETALLPAGPFGALEARVVELYRKLGYPEARVEVERAAPRKPTCTVDCGQINRAAPLRTTPREQSLSGYSPADAVLSVDIVKGPQLDVREVRFEGARHFDQAFLREQLYSYLDEDLPASVISQPVDPYLADSLGYSGDRQQRDRQGEEPPIADPRRLYYRQTYEQAGDHIRDLYRGDGFLSVEISGPELERAGSEEENAAEAVFTIVEGPRTYLYDVQVTGNVQVTTFDLLSSIALETEQPFSFLMLEEARLRALTAYRERGFLYASVEPIVRFSNDGTRAEVVFELVERFVVRVGAIEVRGADRSRESMIRNRVTLRPGELYRPSEARTTEEQLLSLDVFTSVAVAPEEADLPARVKTVVVSVTERRTQWLGWSGGFSTGEGARGGMEYGYRNLFGAALRASLRGQIGYQFVFLDDEIRANYLSLEKSQRIEYQLTASIATPYIPNAPKIGTSLDFVVLQDLQRDYRMQKESLVASMYYRPVKRVVLTIAEELERSYFQVFNQQGETLRNLPPSELVPFGGNSLFSSHLSAAWDLRDRAFNPTKGALLSATGQYARTLRDVEQTITGADEEENTTLFLSNMLRFTITGSFYLPLGPKLVFASQMRWGRVVHLEADSRSYPNRLFYLGGINFRGYRQYAMVPQDVQDDPNFDPSNIVSRGAETFVAAQNELRFPIFGQLFGGLFADVGQLWANPKLIENFDIKDLEVTVGVGLRLQTPVAALAFDYGVRQLDFGPFEMKGAFQFAFQRF